MLGSTLFSLPYHPAMAGWSSLLCRQSRAMAYLLGAFPHVRPELNPSVRCGLPLLHGSLISLLWFLPCFSHSLSCLSDCKCLPVISRKAVSFFFLILRITLPKPLCLFRSTDEGEWMDRLYPTWDWCGCSQRPRAAGGQRHGGWFQG